MTQGAELRRQLQNAYRDLGEFRAPIRFPHPHRFAPGPSDGHFHLRAELFYQCTGTTRFRFPSESLDLEPGQILIVPSRVFHAESILPGPEPFSNVVLYADEGTLSCHLADAGPDGHPRCAYPERMGGSQCSPVASWLQDAVEIDRGDPQSQEVVIDLVRSILAMTLRLLDQPSARVSSVPLVVVRCQRLIHEDLGNPQLSVAALAQRLGCNPDYLSHLFRLVQGERLTAYIENQRMTRAAELLRQSSLSCKEVAWASGYASQSYFIRCFSRRWGCSPGNFRHRTEGTPGKISPQTAPSFPKANLSGKEMVVVSR